MPDYKPHNGKSNFRSEKPVRVLYRNGQESKQVIPANKWRAKDRDWQSDWDIVGARAEGPDGADGAPRKADGSYA